MQYILTCYYFKYNNKKDIPYYNYLKKLITIDDKIYENMDIMIYLSIYAV